MVKKEALRRFYGLVWVVWLGMLCGCMPATVEKPSQSAKRVICSGSGMMRLLVYMQCADRAVAVEQVEKGTRRTTPYQLASPFLKDLPVFGESHGRDHAEAIVSLPQPPELIFRTQVSGTGVSSEELQRRTGIPVVELAYGNLEDKREVLYDTLRKMGEWLDKRERAEEVISFFEKEIAELQRRTEDLKPEEMVRVYIGGVSYRGARGFHSTRPGYAPFQWVHAQNVAEDLEKQWSGLPHTMVSPEQILAWNPEVIFLDLGTLGVENQGGWRELQENSLYQTLRAVQEGTVYTVLPSASYNNNYEIQLLNAWFIGKTLYPKRFSDIDMRAKTREILTFLVGTDVWDEMEPSLKEKAYQGMALEMDSQEDAS